MSDIIIPYEKAKKFSELINHKVEFVEIDPENEEITKVINLIKKGWFTKFKTKTRSDNNNGANKPWQDNTTR